MTRHVTDRIEDVLQRLRSEPLKKGFHKQGWLEFPNVPFADKLQGFDLYVEDAYGDTHGPFRNLPDMEVGYVGNQRQNHLKNSSSLIRQWTRLCLCLKLN